MMCDPCKYAGRLIAQPGLSFLNPEYWHEQCAFKDCTCQHQTTSMIQKRRDG